MSEQGNGRALASLFEQFEVISVYSRKQAIEDGTLIDVSATAREAGIRFPTALTSAVWHQYVRVPEGVEAQDETGRLWDIVWMLRCAIIGGNGARESIRFPVLVRNDNRRPRRVTLKAVCGPGDDAEPVITVMLPDED